MSHLTVLPVQSIRCEVLQISDQVSQTTSYLVHVTNALAATNPIFLFLPGVGRQEGGPFPWGRKTAFPTCYICCRQRASQSASYKCTHILTSFYTNAVTCSLADTSCLNLENKATETVLIFLLKTNRSLSSRASQLLKANFTALLKGTATCSFLFAHRYFVHFIPKKPVWLSHHASMRWLWTIRQAASKLNWA